MHAGFGHFEVLTPVRAGPAATGVKSESICVEEPGRRAGLFRGRAKGDLPFKRL